MARYFLTHLANYAAVADFAVASSAAPPRHIQPATSADFNAATADSAAATDDDDTDTATTIDIAVVASATATNAAAFSPRYLFPPSQSLILPSQTAKITQ